MTDDELYEELKATKISKEEQEAIEKLKEVIKEYEDDDDREYLHIKCDDLIMDFLLKNNFIKLYTEYKKISEEFWYA